MAHTTLSVAFKVEVREKIINEFLMKRLCFLVKNVPKKIIEKNQNVAIFIYSVIDCLYKCIEIYGKNVIYKIKTSSTRYK